ncbi:MAG: hypothetical protein COB36_00125 [Alphaproteobacteria bacterium]|nr:MAG: hypothetical protein COB36_00125 [Alphaproteobacteria bacterium]
MLLFKVLFVVVALSIGLIVFNSMYGDNFLFSAIKSRISFTSDESFSAKETVYDENCLPQKYIGNKYFEIKIPAGFCGCLEDGKDAISQSEKSGKIIEGEAFTSMCIDVYYKVPFLAQCKNINKKLSKSKKESRLDCSCFARKVNALLSGTIASDFSMETPHKIIDSFMDADDVNAGLDRMKQSMDLNVGGSQSKRPIYSVPQGVITSCMKHK